MQCGSGHLPQALGTYARVYLSTKRVVSRFTVARTSDWRRGGNMGQTETSFRTVANLLRLLCRCSCLDCFRLRVHQIPRHLRFATVGLSRHSSLHFCSSSHRFTLGSSKCAPARRQRRCLIIRSRTAEWGCGILISIAAAAAYLKR